MSNVERGYELRTVPGLVKDLSVETQRRVGGLGVPYNKRSRLLPWGVLRGGGTFGDAKDVGRQSKRHL